MINAISDSNNSVQKVAIVGASGYAGAELVGLLGNHSKAQICHLVVSENSSSEGKAFSDLHGRFKGVCDLPLQAFSKAWFDEYAITLIFNSSGSSAYLENRPNRVTSSSSTKSKN